MKTDREIFIVRVSGANDYFASFDFARALLHARALHKPFAIGRKSDNVILVQRKDAKVRK